jgi:hypothetical protein
MDEEQFEALCDLMNCYAESSAGYATHQPRVRSNLVNAKRRARMAFGLLVEEDDESEEG